MAVSGNLHKLSFGGPLSTDETWSCGLHFSTVSTTLTDPEAASAALSAWVGRAESKLGNHIQLEWIKLNRIDPTNGHYADPGVANTFFLPVPVPGLGGTGFPQLSLAISLKTAVSRGRGHAGRIFPPLTGGLLADMTGHASVNDTNGIAQSAKQLLDDLNSDLDGKCVVFSKLAQVDNDITHVSVGRVIDTMQRRRKQLAELYSTPLALG